jgi:hypothetical protein
MPSYDTKNKNYNPIDKGRSKTKPEIALVDILK